MSSMRRSLEPQLLDRIRAWLGEGPGARRLALALEPRVEAVYALGVEALGVEAPGQVSPHVGVSGATVVVLDGAVPIGSDELAMLTEVPAPAAAVVFALAGGSDDPGHRERNRALLAEFTPGLESAPMVPAHRQDLLASAVTAAESRMRGRDRVAEVAASALEFEIHRQRRRLGELQRDPRFDRLRAQRAAMLRSRQGTQLQGGGARGLPAQLAGLRTGFGLAKVDLSHEIAGRCRQLSSAVRVELDGATKSSLRGFPDRLRDGLVGLGGELDRGIAERLRAVTLPVNPAPSVTPGSSVKPGSSVTPGSSIKPASAEALAPVLVEPRVRTLALEDRLMIVMGASGGLGIGRLLTTPLELVGLSESLSVPVMLAFGAGLAWWIVRARGNLGDRQRMRQWAGDSIAEFKAQWERALAQRALDGEASAVGAVGEQHAQLVQETDRQLGELEASLARIARERDGRARLINDRLAQAARLQAALAPHVACSVVPVGVVGTVGLVGKEGINHVDVG